MTDSAALPMRWTTTSLISVRKRNRPLQDSEMPESSCVGKFPAHFEAASSGSTINS
jgi:hypothetical protein